MSQRRMLVGAILAGAIAGFAAPGAHAATGPTALTVNYASHPLGIESTPHFSWDSGVPQQTAYEVKVTSASAPIWDTGTVSSSDDLNVAYGGPSLASGTRYDWQVRVWDASGNASPWSDPDWFETGMLNQSDWTAKWISGRPVQDHNWGDMTETVGFSMPTTGANAGFLFHAQPVGKTSWGESYRWQLSLAAGANTTLSAPAAAGDSNLKVASVSNLAVGRTLAIDSETVTITAVGSAAANTTLAAPAAAGDTTLRVASVSGYTAGAPLTIDGESATIGSVGTAAGAATTLFAPAAAGATNVKVAGTSGIVAGQPIAIEGEQRTVATVGTQGRNTTLSTASAAGATGVRVASTTGLTAGDTLTVGGETATIASIPSPAPASPNPNVLLTAALGSAHASGAAVSDAGTGVTLTSGLASAHAAGSAARGLGTGITIAQPLTQSHASGAAVGSLGTGVTVAPALTKDHASGATVSQAAAPQLVEQVQHYNKAIDHTSEQNGPGPAATVATALATITPSQLAAAGFTGDNYTSPHQLTIRTSGATITTSIDGTVVATLTPTAGTTQPDGYNDLQASGTVGFASGSSITVSSLSVTGAAGNFATTFANGANPLQSGDVTPAGLVLPGVVSADNTAHDSVLPIANPAPLLVKQFDALAGHGAVAAARLYVAGAGWPIVSIDGTPVTDARMYPDRVDYGKRIPYNTFDVTKLVQSGHNAIGTQLGRGYFALSTPDTWMWQQAPYDIGVPAFLAQLKHHLRRRDDADGGDRHVVEDAGRPDHLRRGLHRREVRRAAAARRLGHARVQPRSLGQRIGGGRPAGLQHAERLPDDPAVRGDREPARPRAADARARVDQEAQHAGGEHLRVRLRADRQRLAADHGQGMPRRPDDHDGRRRVAELRRHRAPGRRF